MRRYIGYREFVQRDQRSLVGTALLLTGSHEQAIRLTLRAFHTVALSWPPPVWENPSTHAQIALYRRFLQRPSSAGDTALVRVPPRRRLLTVACLHDGRTHAEMAAVLGLPEETVRAEIAEAVETLTKGDEKRLVTRMATGAGEASVPDLTALSMRTIRRRRLRGALLAVTAALVPVALIVAFTMLQRGEVLNSALGGPDSSNAVQGHEPVRAISTPPPATSPSGDASPSSGTSPSRDASPGATASPDTTASPKAASPEAASPGANASPAPWRAPRTSSVIRYAVPARCPGKDVTASGAHPARPGDVICAGWTLRLVPGASQGAAPGRTDCEGDEPCGSTLSVPDAAQRLAHGDDGGRHRLDPAISRDGRRIAYLSAAERRYVAHDLGSGVKRYLSPVLTPGDTRNGTLVSVSSDGRHFTVTLGERRLRTDFTTGALTSLPAARALPAEKAAAWLRERYGSWADSPNGRYSVAVGGGKAAHRDARGPRGLHVIDAGARRVLRRLPLPDAGRPADGEVVSWLNGREVAVRMSAATGGEPLGLFRVDAVTGRAELLPGLPADGALVLGATTAL